ncbi:hypothetical protein U9M48_003928 [Paspalum notatum var. saurae]|uniref:Uncharacterized protein n=1 Tax=Paspalum notatum var. saurae TaxID=547442 RepID=A0AAQ3PNY3_PASNO
MEIMVMMVITTESRFILALSLEARSSEFWSAVAADLLLERTPPFFLMAASSLTVICIAYTEGELRPSSRSRSS